MMRAWSASGVGSLGIYRGGLGRWLQHRVQALRKVVILNIENVSSESTERVRVVDELAEAHIGIHRPQVFDDAQHWLYP
jgi:hypothetical protein